MIVKKSRQPKKLRLPRGEYVFEEGNDARFAYILEDGEIEIVKRAPEGEILFGTVTEGEVFGEMAIIDGSARSASARARTDATVVEVDKDFFLQHISQKPEAALNLMRKLSGYARAAGKRASGSLLDAGVPLTTNGLGKNSSADNTAIAEAVEDTDAIYQAPPSRPVAIAGGAIMVFLLTIVTWLSLTFVDMTVSARGKFTTKVPNVMVQATDNSVIEELLVERGQVVKKDDVIARLDGTFVNANLKIIEDKLSASEKRLRRILAEQKIVAEGRPEDREKLDPINEEILSKRLDEYFSRVHAFDTQLNKIARELESDAADLELVKAQIGVKRQVEDARRQLYKKNLGSLLNLLTAKDQTLSADRERHAILNKMGNIRAQREAVVAERQAFIAERSAALAEDFAKNEEERVQLTEELRKLKRQEKNLFVRSPVNGIVLDLPTVSAGSIVKQGEPIVTLVRSGVPLALEVDIDPKDVSDIRLGASVSVKLDSLPFQQYGDLKGTLVFVSDDTFEESLQGEEGAFYRGRVRLNEGQEQSLPDDFRLTPGMLASADMKVGERRLVTYFTNPVVRTLGSAMREPD